MGNQLVLIRRVVAAISIVAALLFMGNITDSLPFGINLDFIFNIQLIPAIISGTIITVVAIAIITLLFGRIYCSAVCPLGILQDIIVRLRTKRQKKKARKRAGYRSPNSKIRYIILIGTIITIPLGGAILLLDPYSIFGRIVTTFISPVIIAINNLLATVANSFGSYIFVTKDYNITGISVAMIMLITVIAIIYLTLRKGGRMWCNTVCPVGTTLGVLSKWSLAKVAIDGDKCTKCRQCAKTCKSNTIDDKSGYRVDYSRCVSCYNCISKCKQGAISIKIGNRVTNNRTDEAER